MHRASLAFVAALLAGAACSSSSSTTPCSADGTVTVQVLNTNIDSDVNFICNATVTIASQSGGSATPLTPRGYDGSDANCIYVINEPPGSYVVMATATGFSSYMENITITTSSCVASTASVQAPLTEEQGVAVDGGADSGDDSGVSVFRDGATFGPG
jgi:hypothetical protein